MYYRHGFMTGWIIEVRSLTWYGDISFHVTFIQFTREVQSKFLQNFLAISVPLQLCFDNDKGG